MNKQHVRFLSGCLDESEKAFTTSLTIMSQHDLPKSILKPSTGYIQNLPCAKSLELPSIKLVKSVLKRECEDSEQSTMTLSSSDMYPRSILKSNLCFTSGQTANVDVTTSTSEGGTYDIETQNLSSEIVKYSEKLNNSNGMTNITQHNLQLCSYNDTIEFKESDAKENEASVPFHKTAIFCDEEIPSNCVDRIKCKNDTVLSNVAKKSSDKCRDNALAIKPNQLLNIDGNSNNNDDANEYCNSKGDGQKRDTNDVEKEKTTMVEQDIDNNDNNDRALSSFVDHQIRHVTNEKRISISQHGLPLPERCRSATQVVTSIETSNTPSVSIADRLAALRHNGSTNWKQRIASGRTEESCNASLLKDLKENTTTIKSNVLANCIGKLESAMESWKSRVVAPDAINFTVAGKMKVTRSKDANSPFFSKATANVPNQKKKASHSSQWLKTREGKDKIFRI